MVVTGIAQTGIYFLFRRQGVLDRGRPTWPPFLGVLSPCGSLGDGGRGSCAKYSILLGSYMLRCYLQVDITLSIVTVNSDICFVFLVIWASPPDYYQEVGEGSRLDVGWDRQARGCWHCCYYAWWGGERALTVQWSCPYFLRAAGHRLPHSSL